jgi:hypothetical protein
VSPFNIDLFRCYLETGVVCRAGVLQSVPGLVPGLLLNWGTSFRPKQCQYEQHICISLCGIGLKVGEIAEHINLSSVQARRVFDARADRIYAHLPDILAAHDVRTVAPDITVRFDICI